MDALPAPRGGHQKLRRRDATPDLLSKHPNVTVAIYVRRQMKHLKHASEILKKHT